MKKEKNGSISTYRLISKMKKEDILRLSRMTCRHGHSFLSHPSCAYKEEVVLTTSKGRKLVIKEKIGFLDIETFTFNFKADMGFMMTYCIKDLDGKVHTNCITPKECMLSKDNDKRLMKDLIKDLKRYTRVIGHFSTLFDIPFVRTRAVYYGMDFPIYKEIYHSDTFFLLKGKFSLRSKSLANACKFFGIEAKGHRFDFQLWYNAAKGDKKALKHVLDHNIEDVISTQELWKKIRLFSMETKRSI